MYSNKVSIAASDEECFLRFDFIGPDVKDDGSVEKVAVFESQKITMSRGMLIKLRELIDDVLSSKDNQESNK